ncbi:caspase-2-like [Ciona intestinalis]
MSPNIMRPFMQGNYRTQKIKVLIEQMKRLGRMDIVKIIETFKEKEFPKNVPVYNINIQDAVLVNTCYFSQQATVFKDVCTFKEENVHILECDAKFYTDHSVSLWNEVYPIQHRSPKAHVLILNNYNGFKGWSQHDRHEAERDGKLMKQLWEGFQCEVKVEENQTAERMWEKLEKFSKSDIHEKCDFCVVIIMSHGGLVDGQEVVDGIDGENIPTEDVVKLFHNSTDRPHLIGKPKLIFFQSFRGGKNTK